MKNKIALIGFGTVGQGLCEILLEKNDELNEKYGFEWDVVAISDMQKGSVFAPDGLNVKKCLDIVNNNGSLDHYNSGSEIIKGWDALTTISNSNANIICELSYTNVQTGEPATSHCRMALGNGKHVVTSNKGPAALNYSELKNLATQNSVQILIEGTVVSGTPVINLIRGPLAGCSISKIKGILNGTTNYILTEMEDGALYAEALQKAQDLGYAEADPIGDVEGYDAMVKVIILANVVMGVMLKPADVHREGITKISKEMIAEAKTQDSRWKLIGSIENTPEGVKASVQPEKISSDHPLAGVGGATNALTFSTDLMGDITIIGAGAGKIETGYSILTDILEIHREQN